MTGNEEVYFLPRDKQESIRLDSQHHLYNDVTNGPIHHSIPRASLLAIADVGTGTGIWLQEAKRTLEAGDGSLIKLREYHGFDISAVLFTDKATEDMKLHIHDVLTPFKSQYLQHFDLVHVRLFVGAIKVVDYDRAIRNMMALLKPGGYLQWVDYDISSQLRGNARQYPQYGQIIKSFFDNMEQAGLSASAPEELYKAFQRLNLQHVVKYDYLAHQRDELQSQITTWSTTGMVAALAVAYLRLGMATNWAEAKYMSTRDKEKIQELHAQGLRTETLFCVIVAQNL